MKKCIEVTSVEEYIQAQPEHVRKALLEIRSIILSVEPSAQELLNYGIPAYALTPGGKRNAQIMIAGYKNHIGFYPHPTTMEEFEPQLKQFVRGKGSVQFPLNQPLPVKLIGDMVRYRRDMLKK